METSKNEEQQQEEDVDPMLEYKNFVYGAVKKTFSLLFNNGEVQISVDNIVPLLDSMKISSNDEDIFDLIRTSYIESAGAIDATQLDDIIVRMRKENEDEEEAIKRAFELIDIDNDGVVTGADINQLLMNLGLMVTDEELVTMLESVDSDGDGRFDFDDFKKFVLQLSTEREEEEEKEEADEIKSNDEMATPSKESSEPKQEEVPKQDWVPQAATKQRRMALCFGYVNHLKRTESKINIDTGVLKVSVKKEDVKLPLIDQCDGDMAKNNIAKETSVPKTITEDIAETENNPEDTRRQVIGKIFQIQEEEACGQLDNASDKKTESDDSSQRKGSVSSNESGNKSGDGMEVDEPLIVPTVAHLSHRDISDRLTDKLVGNKYSDKENYMGDKSVTSKPRPQTAPAKKVVNEKQRAAKLKRIQFLEKAILRRSNTMPSLCMGDPSVAKSVTTNRDHRARRFTGVDTMTGFIVRKFQSGDERKKNRLNNNINVVDMSKSFDDDKACKDNSPQNPILCNLKSDSVTAKHQNSDISDSDSFKQNVSVIDVSKSFDNEKAYKESAKQNATHSGHNSIVPLTRVLMGFMSTNNKTKTHSPSKVTRDYTSISRSIEKDTYPLKKTDCNNKSDRYEQLRRSQSVVNLKLAKETNSTPKPKKISMLSRLIY